MLLIVAWAYGRRTMSSQSCPAGRGRRCTRPAPRMNRGSSLRLTEWPMPPTSGVVWRRASVVISSLPLSRPRPIAERLGRLRRAPTRPRQLAGRLLDRLDDVHVAGAAAEVAADPLPDLLLVRVRVLVEQPGRLHDHARRAEAALEAVLVPERLLERVERRAVGHALDRLDLGAVGLDGEHRARLGALAVDVDGARAAVAGVAADVRAGEAEVVAQEVDEQEPRLDVGLVRLAVDGER